MSEAQIQRRAEHPIHAATLIGEVALHVAELAHQIAFYTETLGFALRERSGNEAVLGAPTNGSKAGEGVLLRLTEQPAFKRYKGVTGLYHFAVLLPNRRELARSIGRLLAQRYPNHPTDHIMTKTTYLDDPEGNGMELYAESPEDGTWSMANGQYVTRRADGSLSAGREPLDLEALLTNLMQDDRLDVPVPAETRMGHVHLHVRDIDEAVSFYHGVLGFDLMGKAAAFRMAFVSAGGYHHHIGLNTWQGEAAPPPASDALGMRYFQVLRAARRDPDRGIRPGDPGARPFAERCDAIGCVIHSARPAAAD
jgi:catechol 2,3-dioxygenase